MNLLRLISHKCKIDWFELYNQIYFCFHFVCLIVVNTQVFKIVIAWSGYPWHEIDTIIDYLLSFIILIVFLNMIIGLVWFYLDMQIWITTCSFGHWMICSLIEFDSCVRVVVSISYPIIGWFLCLRNCKINWTQKNYGIDYMIFMWRIYFNSTGINSFPWSWESDLNESLLI